jgi:hypothetical protein
MSGVSSSTIGSKRNIDDAAEALMVEAFFFRLLSNEGKRTKSKREKEFGFRFLVVLVFLESSKV